jgi:putative transposase
VARLMRRGGLTAARRRRVPRTTDSRHDHPVAPNLLGRVPVHSFETPIFA